MSEEITLHYQFIFKKCFFNFELCFKLLNENADLKLNTPDIIKGCFT